MSPFVANESHIVPGNLQAALYPLSLSFTTPLCPEYQEQEYCTLCYVTKALCTPTEQHRGIMAEETQIIPCSVYSHAHTGVTSPTEAHLHKPRGSQGHQGSWEQKIGTQRKGNPVQDLPRAVPGKAKAHSPGMEPIKRS